MHNILCTDINYIKLHKNVRWFFTLANFERWVWLYESIAHICDNRVSCYHGNNILTAFILQDGDIL